jgi:sugar/nucleoside kinase (ribokinase family)
MAKILGLGGVCIDRLVKIPRIPGWDETEYVSNYAMQQGGMVATAMAAATRLGEDVEFIGGIGDDDSGQYALQSFKAAAIKTDQVKIFRGDSTAFSLVLVHESSGKERNFFGW